MIRLKKLIVGSFLWVFLVPQLNNVLHYWVIKHDFAREQHSKPVVSNKSNVHYCEQTLFKIPSMLLFFQDFDLTLFIIDHQKRDSALVQVFKSTWFIGYYLRGPPYLSVLTELNTNPIK